MAWSEPRITTWRLYVSEGPLVWMVPWRGEPGLQLGGCIWGAWFAGTPDYNLEVICLDGPFDNNMLGAVEGASVSRGLSEAQSPWAERNGGSWAERSAGSVGRRQYRYGASPSAS